jgi:hypothetical protein
MTRYLSTLSVFAAVCLWAGAQGPSTQVRADQRIHQFERNRAMIESIVDGSLKISQSHNALAKSETYSKILSEMQSEISKAAHNKERERLKELSKQIGIVLSDGFVPNLITAREEIAKGSQDEGKLLEVRDSAGKILKSLIESVPQGDKVKIQDLNKLVEGVK